MQSVSSIYRAESTHQFFSLVAPWLLQGVIFLCETHGSMPFWASGDGGLYSAGSGPISGTALFVVEISVWILTFLSVTSFGRSQFKVSSKHVILLSLPFLALVSTLWSTAYRATVAGAAALLFLTLIGIHIADHFSPYDQMRLFILAGVLAAVSSLSIAFFAPQVGLESGDHAGSLRGIFTHKNGCGIDMVYLVAPAIYLRRAKRSTQLLLWAYVAVCLGMIVLSQARTAWIDLIVLLVATRGSSILRAFKRKDRVIVALCLFLSIMVLMVVALENLDAITIGMGKDPSFSGRTVIWAAVLGAIAKKPILGYGYGAFFSSMNAGVGSLTLSTRFVFNHPHNGYLATWLDLGLVGLGICVAMIVKAVKDAGRAWRTHPYTDWYVSIIGLLLFQNIDEIGMAKPNDLSWLLFVMACAGLHNAARSAKAAAVPRALDVGHRHAWAVPNGMPIVRERRYPALQPAIREVECTTFPTSA